MTVVKFFQKLPILTKSMSDNCTFCKIVAGNVSAEIYYQDSEMMVFKDIKPASKIHVLAVSTEHIPNVNSLTSQHKPLLEKLILQGKKVITEKGGNIDDILMGFHRPPFNSVSHLHLHLICPKSDMSYLSHLVFKPNTWWFITVEDVLSKL